MHPSPHSVRELSASPDSITDAAQRVGFSLLAVPSRTGITRPVLRGDPGGSPRVWHAQVNIQQQGENSVITTPHCEVVKLFCTFTVGETEAQKGD